MENINATPDPEYAFTAHEIEVVNAGTLHVLERDWLKETGNEWNARPPEYLSHEESERLGIAGSSYKTILDFGHAQEPALAVLSMANSYAYGVKRRVNAMYEEAYAANDFPAGPSEFFAELKSQQELDSSPRGRITRFLGSLINR
jgi:hypothetical protein